MKRKQVSPQFYEQFWDKAYWQTYSDNLSQRQAIRRKIQFQLRTDRDLLIAEQLEVEEVWHKIFKEATPWIRSGGRSDGR